MCHAAKPVQRIGLLTSCGVISSVSLFPFSIPFFVRYRNSYAKIDGRYAKNCLKTFAFLAHLKYTLLEKVRSFTNARVVQRTAFG